MLKGNTFGLKAESSRLFILLLTIAACFASALYFISIRGIVEVHTHIFYVPIVLASMWYHKKAVYVALFLSMVLLLAIYFSPLSISIYPVARTATFIAVAYIIGYISSKRAEGEEELTKSKAYTESIIQNFSDTLIVVDAEARIQTVNPATCHLLGYTEEEVIGQPVGIIFEEEVHRVFQFFREPEKAEAPRRQDAIRNRQLTYKTKDGRLIPMLFNASVLTDEGGSVTGVVAVAKDITELKLAAAEIRREKVFSQNIVATVPDSLLVLDKDLRIKSANRTFYETFQTEPEKVIGSRITDILGDEDGRLSAELTRLFGTEDMLENLELLYQSEILGERIFNVTARGMLVAEEEEEELVVLQDITQRKRGEEALRESEEKYRSLVESTEDSIYLVDRDCRYLFMNNKHLSRIGLSMEEIRGRTYGELHSEEDTKEFTERVEEVFETGKSSSYEHRSHRDNRYFLRTLSPVKDSEERITAITVISKDITDHKQAEELLRRSFIQLAETVSRAMESQDPYTVGHQRKVAELSRTVGEKIGFNQERLLGLYIAGLLHDIGKIAIPAEILTHPGKLSEPEWALIRSHSCRGYEILKKTEFPWPVADMARHHHERLDGSGYPDGIKGDELSLEVRILAVCDVVDAMSSDRPYRPARSKEEVVDELRTGRGIKYDPQVVDILLEMIEKRE
ncbi:TPA: hypothetical protein DD712_04590 [Candidatus Acetothermia bacterium]|nr:hypothetical protein [Candidatus Acetothermia bacterium]